MRVAKVQRIKFLLFLCFFGFTGTHFILQRGLGRGLYLTLLTWSFFVLCIPFSGRPLITSFLLNWFTNIPAHYAGLVRWLAAIGFNLFTYIVFPYIYLTSATTFLLYRVITNPWPYWIIIFASSLAGLYTIVVTSLNRSPSHPKDTLARALLLATSVLTFFYLSYSEIIIFLYSKTF